MPWEAIVWKTQRDLGASRQAMCWNGGQTDCYVETMRDSFTPPDPSAWPGSWQAWTNKQNKGFPAAGGMPAFLMFPIHNMSET